MALKRNADSTAPSLPSRETSSSTTDSALTPDERHRKIQLAAYYLAERRGFHAGCELENWLAAERAVDLQDDRG